MSPWFVRHPLFVTIAIVIVCVVAGGAAAGGHVIHGWGSDAIQFFHGLTGH